MSLNLCNGKSKIFKEGYFNLAFLTIEQCLFIKIFYALEVHPIYTEDMSKMTYKHFSNGTTCIILLNLQTFV